MSETCTLNRWQQNT